MTSALPPPWTDLGRGVLVRQSRLYRMNSAVLAGPDHVTVVDPGILPSEIADIAGVVRSLGRSAMTLVFTHGDWDHVLGRAAWPGAATVGHSALAAELVRGRDPIRAEARRVAAEAGEAWEREFEPFRPGLAVDGLHPFRLGGLDVVARDAFGHSASMLSLHVPGLRLLVAGDMLSDIEIPIITQRVALFRRALSGLLPLVRDGGVEMLIPGHGAPALSAAEALGRVRRDLGYLDGLDGRVREAVQAGRSLDDTLAREDAIDLGAWRQDPAVDLTALHRDNVRTVYAGFA